MSILHGRYDTALWSQLVERDTPMFASRPHGAQSVSQFQGTGTLVASPIGVKMGGVDRQTAVEILGRFHAAQGAFYVGGDADTVRALLTEDVA